MRGLADGGVVHVQVRADRAHDDLARMKAHANANRDALLPAQLLGAALHGLLHPQRRVARAHGVILVRERGAEQRHDPVAHHLVDGALEAVHGLHHVLEHRIEQLPGLLGIAVGKQLHRALQVREEHRY